MLRRVFVFLHVPRHRVNGYGGYCCKQDGHVAFAKPVNVAVCPVGTGQGFSSLAGLLLINAVYSGVAARVAIDLFAHSAVLLFCCQTKTRVRQYLYRLLAYFQGSPSIRLASYAIGFSVAYGDPQAKRQRFSIPPRVWHLALLSGYLCYATSPALVLPAVACL